MFETFSTWQKHCFNIAKRGTKLPMELSYTLPKVFFLKRIGLLSLSHSSLDSIWIDWSVVALSTRCIAKDFLGEFALARFHEGYQSVLWFLERLLVLFLFLTSVRETFLLWWLACIWVRHLTLSVSDGLFAWEIWCISLPYGSLARVFWWFQSLRLRWLTAEGSRK